MDHDLELLAVQLASMPDAKREWIVARTRDLLKQRRMLGERLSGKRDSRWSRVVAGGLLYDNDGMALARVISVMMHREPADRAEARVIAAKHGVGDFPATRQEVTRLDIRAEGIE